jgi:outer membrane protein assembly factor BamB
MSVGWKRISVFSLFMAFVMLFSVLMPVLGDSSIVRYDEKRTGNSGLVSDITDPEPRWTFDTTAVTGSGLLAGDINDDGKIEIVWGSSDGTLYALDEDGQVVWTFQAIGPFYASPAIGDIDGDGMSEVVIGGSWQGNVGGDPNLYAVNGEDGSLLWTFTTTDKGSAFEKGFESAPTLYDVDEDGKLDVLIGSRNYYFYALNGADGTIIWESEFEHFVRSTSPIGDIDKDGIDEILAVDNHALAKLLEIDGSVDWEINLEGYAAASTPTFADVNGDGYDEIIIFTVGWAAMGKPGVPLVYKYDGTLLWSNDKYTYFYSTPTLFDVDGDGLLDILNVDSDDQVLIAYKGTDGTILYTVEPFEKKFMGVGLSTADIDGDGEIEILVGANPNLFSINAADGSVEWIYDSSGERVGGALIADLDGDGLAEIIIKIGGSLICLQNKNDPFDLLDKIIEYILSLPDECFKNNAEQRKNALVNKLEEVRQMMMNGDYEGAIAKLKNDIRPKMDGEGKNDWIICGNAQDDLTDMIDMLIEYLESLL